MAAIESNYDDLSVDEFSNIDTSLVMSLLQEGDRDDDTLRLMIESFEPGLADQCLSSETSVSGDNGYRFCDEMSRPDFEWVDMEAAYSCPSDEIAGYFDGRFAAEYEGLEDYSRVWYDDMPMAMEEEDDYIGLWQ
ncbi:hypothetical protein AAHA92_27133 [Salvia divinorum]|uniref:Uncharacterized protein n=1 Tax=Salvia divinorum TaxID=28513 RepID=A0ABD1G2P0_SALDI